MNKLKDLIHQEIIKSYGGYGDFRDSYCVDLLEETFKTYSEGLLEFITNEKSRLSIIYGEQKERFAELKDNTVYVQEYTIKEIIELYNKTL